MCVSVCARVHMHIHGCACLHAYSYNNLYYLYIRTYVATSIVRIYFLSARYILCSFVHTFLPNSTEFAEYTFSCRAKLSFGVKFQFVYN